MPVSFRDLLRESLRFKYQAGGVALLQRGHTTGWRVLPGLMLSQAQRGAERIFLAEGRSSLAKTGEIVVLPAGVRHKVDVVGRSEVRRWAHVNYFLVDSLDLFSLFDAPLVCGRGLGARIGDLIQAWVQSEGRRKELSPLEYAAEVNEFGFRLLGLLSPHCHPGTGLCDRFEGLRRLGPVIEHIRRNFHQPLHRDGLARMAFLSPTQFHLAFRRATGKSPIKFLEAVRLQHAQQLLISTARKISDIAGECGYADPYVFSKFFKRACGFSPSAYRLAIADLRPTGQSSGLD
jgi:AraC-like DNA-binding protein